MKILVCVKQVPDTTEVKIDKEKGTLIRDGIKSIMNPDDKNALEEGLRLKDTIENAEVTVITMGPPQAKEVLREAFSMGADKGVLVSDRAFGGADTWATSNTLAAAIRKIGSFDIIFAGRQAIDGDTAQVGPQISEKLGLPQVTYVRGVKIKGDKVTVERSLENGKEIIESRLPILLTVVKEINEPRYMFVDKIFEAYEKEIRVLTMNDLDISIDEVGLKASPTKVYKSFTPKPKEKGEILEGNSREKVKLLLKKLDEKHLI